MICPGALFHVAKHGFDVWLVPFVKLPIGVVVVCVGERLCDYDVQLKEVVLLVPGIGIAYLTVPYFLQEIGDSFLKEIQP